ncbi:alpha-N-acetylgalactosaminidase-like [Corticium candelabrum]|uniref:alpha-N-acetylgalactosaminidase-like n=1 Tax=Corticium candelabrum TaxID=121492 RepID=UPI002E259EA1|nr:alpha-N-acetylgalactosaminidase-like [Corticium candelabrum]
MLMTCFLMILLTPFVESLNNGLTLTPPMGWLDWERFRCNIDCTNDPVNCIGEKLFMDIIDHMAADGFKDVGYEQVNIDDCWSLKERDAQGRLQADPKRFPHGIKYLADYAHSKGLKLGIYGDFGTHTCGGYPGSEDHLQTDAQTFAEWGIDMLKLDGCNSRVQDMDVGYPAMMRALNATGRPIIYSCSWPDYQRASGIKVNYTNIAINCNLWRNYADIQDSWDSVTGIIDYYGNSQDLFAWAAGPGHWNDPDMLIVGDFSLSYDQSKAQMALWAIFAAPLLMSNDLRKISPEAKEILLNQEVIAVNQDPLGKQGLRVLKSGNFEVWRRELSEKSLAVVLFYRATGGSDKEFSVSFKTLNITAAAVTARDLFAHKDLGTFKESFDARVNPSGVVMVKMTPQ